MTSPGVPGQTPPATPARTDDQTGTGGARCWRWQASSPRKQPDASSTAGCSIPRIWELLEGPDRDAWQRPDQIMDALRIGDGSVVADLGAGGGWFTVRLARRVGPNGRVYAQDIQPQMIESIERRVEARGARRPRDRRRSAPPPIPDCRAGALDAVLIVDAYHEMEHPVALLRNLATLAQARWPHRHRRLHQRRRRAGSAHGRARRSAAGHQRRRGGRPAADLARALSALPIHAGVREGPATPARAR